MIIKKETQSQCLSSWVLLVHFILKQYLFYISLSRLTIFKLVYLRKI